MDRFLLCLCYKDYTALIISGKPTEKELLAAWYLIIVEYNELISIDISENPNWNITKELIRLHNHLYLLQQCIDFLSNKYSENIATSFRRLGYRLKISTENPVPEDYMQQLYVAAEKSKTKWVQIQQLNVQLKKYVESSTDIVPDYAPFEKRIAAIEQMQHAVYDLSTLTVSKFISLENKYRELATANAMKEQLK